MMESVTLFDGERIDEVNESIRLIQRRDGLVFGTDAYLLSAFVRPRPDCLAADLGSGTGIAAFLLLARNKVRAVEAYELQSDFADIISRNARLNGFEDRVSVFKMNVRDAGRGADAERMDIVISNPPYMRADSGRRNDSDAKYIARHEVDGGISDFCLAASRLLKYGGSFYCVYRPDRLCDLISALRESALEPKLMTFVHADSGSTPSMVLVEAKKGGKGSVRVTAPLLLYRDGERSRIMSDDAKRIYDTCSFEQFMKERM